MNTVMHDGNSVGLMVPPVQVVWRDGVMTHRSARMGEYRHKVAAQSGPTGLVTRAHQFGAAGFRVARAGEFRPTSERALASGRPSVIEVPANHRDDLTPVQRMRRRTIE